MGLVKKETIIKPTSSMTLDAVKTATRTMINSYQNGTTNKNTNGTFKDFFFMDIYDSRDGSLYRIYADACETEYGLPKVGGVIFYVVVDKSNTPEESGSGTGSQTFIIG